MFDCFCFMTSSHISLSCDVLVASVRDPRHLVAQSAFTQSIHFLAGLPRGLSPWILEVRSIFGYRYGLMLLTWPKNRSRFLAILSRMVGLIFTPSKLTLIISVISVNLVRRFNKQRSGQYISLNWSSFDFCITRYLISDYDGNCMLLVKFEDLTHVININIELV